MAKVQVSVQIRASRNEVWRVLEDLAGHVRWMADAHAIHFVGDRRTGVGTVFDCDTRVGPLRTVDRMEITEWRPGRAMGVTHRGLVTGTGRFTLTRPWWRPHRTTVTWEEALRFPWWFGGPVGAVAARAVLRAVWRRNLRRLRDLVEAGS